MSSNRPPVMVFQEASIKDAIALDSAVLKIIEDGFAHLARGTVHMPPVMQLLAQDHGGQTCVKGACISGLEYFAVKISSIYPRRPGIDETEANGMFVLIESETGRVRACLLDNGYLTQLRTAAAGTIAAQRLAPAEIETVAVIGAGKQALWQIRAAYLARKFKRVVIWARHVQHAAAMAERVQSLLPVSVSVADTIRGAVAPARVVITTTPSRQPLLDERDLHQGLHITGVGSDAMGKRELSDCLLRKIDIYVADSISQCRSYGELQTLSESDIDRIETLGDIIVGKAQGRERDGQVTVADLTGLGVQDIAIAIEAFRRLTALRLVS